MRFRVFFDLKKYRKKSRDVLFLEKKGSCQECTTQKSGVGMVTRIEICRYPDVQMSGYPDIRYQIPDIRYQVSEK